MKEINSILQKCPLFDGINSNDLTAMLRCLGTKLITKKKGQSIFSQGDPAVNIGIVLSGIVHVVREDYIGNRSIIGTVGPTELFGESYAFSGVQSLPVAVHADTDCQILLIDSRHISSCCSNACDFHNQMISNLLRLVATKNLMLHQKLQITSKRTTREKLMAYLMIQAKNKESNTFTIAFDRQELADYLEVDRSGLSAQISMLRKEGIIECEKNRFRLL